MGRSSRLLQVLVPGSEIRCRSRQLPILLVAGRPSLSVCFATAANTTRSSTSSVTSESIQRHSTSHSQNHSKSRPLFPTSRNVVLFGMGVVTGSFLTLQLTGSPAKDIDPPIEYPSGMPRSCSCEGDHDDDGHEKHVSLQNLTREQKDLPDILSKIVGAENILDGSKKKTPQTTPFLKGMRLGHGQALCIVTLKRLKHVYEILPHILMANCVVVPQGQNTGLTGGSTPRHESTDGRPAVLLSMKHLDLIVPVDHGHRVLCLAGVGLASLDSFLATNYPDRESHANLGSTFLNPTTAAGIALGSGGTQCLRKGPAYTERALYLKITQNKWKQPVVEIVNTLGIKKLLDSKPIVGADTKHYNAVYKLDAFSETIKHGFHQNMCVTDLSHVGAAHDFNYRTQVCQHDHNVTRFNADTHGLDCNRSEGKVVILATVHDTFPKPQLTRSFWIGFESMDLALQFRRQIALDNPQDLPLSVEYVDRDAFDVIDQAGRVMANIISWLGTSSSILRTMWTAKLYIESLPFSRAPIMVDTLLYHINFLFPSVLPHQVQRTGKTMNHHVSMTVGDFGDGSMERLLERLDAFVQKHGDKVVLHDCTNATSQLGAFRFVAAPAFRTWCVGNEVQGFSVDYVLPKNAGQAPTLNATAAKPLKRMRYSHFGCNVVHEDLAYPRGVNLDDAKHSLKHTVEQDCGGKLPAEHGHGTEYHAPPETQRRWQAMDPINVLNPGIGGLSTYSWYGSKKS
jgi:D-lactate dehydrogenase (quinone)